MLCIPSSLDASGICAKTNFILVSRTIIIRISRCLLFYIRNNKNPSYPSDPVITYPSQCLRIERHETLELRRDSLAGCRHLDLNDEKIVDAMCVARTKIRQLR